MNFTSRILCTVIIHIAILLPAKSEFQSSIKSPSIHSKRINNNHFPLTARQMNLNNMNDLIWSEDFENGENGWSLDSGWELTTEDYHTANHSMLSADNNLVGNFHLLSPLIQLPAIGLNEIMYFSFYLNLDMPDADGDENDYLEDYYQVQLKDYSNQTWHISDYNAQDVHSYWCGDESIDGYKDAWIQFIDIPSIPVESGWEFSALIYYSIESQFNDDGSSAEVEGSCTDGWDSANIRISEDGGTTWALLEDSSNPYNFECGYGWIYNDSEYESDQSLNHLAKGWGGKSNDWLDFNTDLSAYAGNEVIIRFAFGSDPAWSTMDDPTLKGVFIDDITIKDASGTNVVSYSAEDGDNDQMVASGYSLTDLYYEWDDQYCYDPETLGVKDSYTSQEDCEGASYVWIVSPGSMGWGESYLVDLHNFEGKDVNFLIRSIYDDDNDGGNGDGLYVDDFTVYKESVQMYAQPQLFNAEVEDDAVQLTWYDMNQSGDSTIIFDSGDESLFTGITLSECTDCLSFAGTLFPAWLGPSTVDSISIYNINESAVEVTVNAYGLTNYEPVQSPLAISLSKTNGWNTFDVSWDFSSVFIIAHSFSDEIAAAFDPSTNMAGLWFLSNDVGYWDYAFIDGMQIAGNWGIRAKVSYDGLNVTYNLYRDGILIQTGLTVGAYTDTDFEYNTDYYYHLGVVYSDVIEVFTPDSIAITTSLPPIPEGVLQLSYDDDSFEGEFNAGGSNYSAVKFTTGSEIKYLYMVKWYQVGGGGAFYLKIFDDNNGAPGDEIYSFFLAQGSGHIDGWNQKVLTSENIALSGDFWIGVKEFSSSRPFGLDATSVSGYSYQREGSAGDWVLVQGNLGIRAYLSSEPLDITSSEIPIKFGIRDIFPNPFNPIANIQFEISEFTQVSLSIYDLNGRLLKILMDDKMNPGQYSSVWGGTDMQGNQVSSGIYLAVLVAGGQRVQTRKLVLLK